jgi:hypothetical protein
MLIVALPAFVFVLMLSYLSECCPTKKKTNGGGCSQKLLRMAFILT